MVQRRRSVLNKDRKRGPAEDGTETVHTQEWWWGIHGTIKLRGVQSQRGTSYALWFLLRSSVWLMVRGWILPWFSVSPRVDLVGALGGNDQWGWVSRLRWVLRLQGLVIFWELGDRGHQKSKVILRFQGFMTRRAVGEMSGGWKNVVGDQEWHSFVITRSLQWSWEGMKGAYSRQVKEGRTGFGWEPPQGAAA